MVAILRTPGVLDVSFRGSFVIFMVNPQLTQEQNSMGENHWTAEHYRILQEVLSEGQSRHPGDDVTASLSCYCGGG